MSARPDDPRDPADPHGHVPVLAGPIVDLLDPQPGQVAVDLTVGRGGHASLLAARVRSEHRAEAGRIIGFDLDADNLEYAGQRLAGCGVPFTAVHDSFVRAPEHLQRLGVRAHVMVADLGFSSNQMKDATRGFSFSADGPLDMRLDREAELTAAQLVARLDERELADLIFEYGEEPLSRRIARKVVQTRKVQPIETTQALAQLVEDAYGARARFSRQHPATRTFMALRIATNDELGALRALLDEVRGEAERMAREREAEGGVGAQWMHRGARIGVVSFHSLEDRLVKRAFAELERLGWARRLTRKPVFPEIEEVQANPRSRSARLRVAMIGAGPGAAKDSTDGQT